MDSDGTTNVRTRRAIEAYFASIADAEAQAFVDQFAEEATFADPVGGPVLTGRDGVAKFHKGLRRAWQRLDMRPTAVHVRGGRAAAAWTATGQSASGKDIAFDGVNVFEVDDDGRIARLEGYWDFEGVIGQM
jgi:steroid delta-isomerase